MNSQNAIERALRLVTPVPSEDEKLRWRTTLNVLLNDARVEFADQVASSDNVELRSLLRREFEPIDCVDGSASLNTPLTAGEPLLLKHLKTADIRLGTVTTRRVTLLPDESTLDLERPNGFAFAALHGTTLRVKSNNAAYSGTVIITAAVIPSLANISGQLEEPFVVVLHSMGVAKTPSPARTQAKELKAVAKENK